MAQQVVLVDHRRGSSQKSLKRLAVILNTQVARDFGPAWDIRVTVTAAGLFWPISRLWRNAWELRVVEQGESAHGNENGRPFASVVGDSSVDLSHELLELVANPYIGVPGRERLLRGPSPVPQQGTVEFRVEVVDPVDGDTYEIEGVRVSNFCLPSFYTGASNEGPFDHLGHLDQPRAIRGPDAILEWWADTPPRVWYQHWITNSGTRRSEPRNSGPT